MKYHKGRMAHAPALGMWGDCFPTSLACVLDMEPEDVPHFFAELDDSDDEECDRRNEWVREWLVERGYYNIDLFYQSDDLETLLGHFGAMNPDIVYLLTGNTDSDVSHVVVCKGGSIIHNTAGNLHLTGPCPKSGMWWLQIIVPTDHSTPFMFPAPPHISDPVSEKFLQ